MAGTSLAPSMSGVPFSPCGGLFTPITETLPALGSSVIGGNLAQSYCPLAGIRGGEMKRWPLWKSFCAHVYFTLLKPDDRPFSFKSQWGGGVMLREGYFQE